MKECILICKARALNKIGSMPLISYEIIFHIYLISYTKRYQSIQFQNVNDFLLHVIVISVTDTITVGAMLVPNRSWQADGSMSYLCSLRLD